MPDVVIRAENLGKRYLIGHEQRNGRRYVALRDVIMQNAVRLWRTAKDVIRGRPIIYGQTHEEVWALKDVSFEVKRGEVLGVIGKNGAGKSTLLKVLSRITEPSAGRVTIKGRVASLLEVGTGFHPELTGRENIYLNGAILGMRMQEIRFRFDEIVAFAGVERFLDTPVKRYSSGMYVRLAFAVAAHLEPEILLIDEVLAVGDAEFQKKCLGKMQEVAGHGRTVLFVSHNLSAIQTLCTRAVLLTGGRSAFDGNAASVVSKYLEQCTSSSSRYAAPKSFRTWHSTALTAVTIHGQDGKEIDTVHSGGPIDIRFHYHTTQPRSHLQCAIGLYNSAGQKLLHFASRSLENGTSSDTNSLPAGNGTIICEIPSLPLTPGRYHLNIYMACDGHQIAYVQSALSINVVEPQDSAFGWVSAARTSAFLLSHRWRCDMSDTV